MDNDQPYADVTKPGDIVWIFTSDDPADLADQPQSFQILEPNPGEDGSWIAENYHLGVTTVNEKDFVE